MPVIYRSWASGRLFLPHHSFLSLLSIFLSLAVIAVVVLHPPNIMVKLTLVSPKGNHGVRFFPSTGYLGLTPLKFEGSWWFFLPTDTIH